MNKKNEVKFDYKEKGKKPVVTKNVLQFSITGSGFNVEKIYKMFSEQGVSELQ